MISEELNSAIEELKRADHSIFATLKYTRSCDVVMSVLERLSKTCTFAVTAGLQYAKDKEIIEEIPPSIKEKEKMFRQIYPDLVEYMDLYAFIRKVLQYPDFSCEEEFRKHLTLITQVDGEEQRINVEMIEEYYFKIKTFLKTMHDVFTTQPEPVEGAGDE